MAKQKQGNPLGVRFNEADLAEINKAAQALGRTRNSLVVEGAKLFARMALSASNAVSADNAAPDPVLADLTSTAGDGQGGQGARRAGGKGRLKGETAKPARM